MKKYTQAVISSILLMVIGLGVFAATPVVAQSTSNLVATPCDPAGGDGGLLPRIFTPWYEYLPGAKVDGDTKCSVYLDDMPLPKTAALILAAVIELLMHVATLVAVGYLIYGAFQYMTSQGDPQGLSGAKSTIANSLIGLVITLLAIAAVQFLGRAYGA